MLCEYMEYKYGKVRGFIFYIYAKIIINICIKPSQIQQSMEEEDEWELLPFAIRD